MDVRNPTDLGMDPRRLEQVERLITESTARHEISGAVVGIARHGSVAYLEAFGERNLEQHLPMERDSLFRIYSMTKAVTTAAIMVLVEQCRIGLYRPISDFFPEFSKVRVYASGEEAPFETEPVSREITLHDLLTHTSGLGYGIGDQHPVELELEKTFAPNVSRTHDMSLREMVRALAQVPLVQQPGTGWRYSLGIDVAGALIEEITDTSLDRYIDETILQPLGMRETWFTVPKSEQHRMAAVYEDTGEGLTVSPDPPMMAFTEPRPALNGGGGLVGTTLDYLRFGQLFLDRGHARASGTQILSPTTIRMMMSDRQQQQWFDNGERGVGFGYGGKVVTNPGLFPQYGAAGLYSWGGAASTDFFTSPADDLTMVFMIQRFPGFSIPLNNDIWTTAHQAIVE